jgi:hypothetical protein
VRQGGAQFGNRWRIGNPDYRITIEGDTIVDRRHVGAEDNCASERYQPVQR